MPVPSIERQQPGGQRWAFAAASGLLLTLLHPPFSLTPLAWVALTPLILAVDGAPPLTACLLGWLAGSIESLGVTGFWMFRAARDYFQFSAVGAAAFTLGVNQVFVAVYFAVFGLTVALARGRLRFLAIPVLFVTAEYARAHLLSGNPWTLLGHSLTNPALIQLCDITGVYGLSFLLALTATGAAELRRTRLPAAGAVVLALLVWLYGTHRLVGFTPVEPVQIQVALVQGNLPNGQRGRPEFFTAHLQRYLDLTLQANPTPAALIVWPENAIGFFLEDNPALVGRITHALPEDDGALLIGAPRAGGRSGVATIYNSAYLLNAKGVQAVYDKRVLLPFVERLPLRPEDSPYLPGVEPTIFSVAGTRFGTLICYEAIYPELARALVARGAQFLVNISNDSWFDAGAGPEQHYASARFRAVENRVSLVRVTNSGVSGVIDPAGREIVRLAPRQAVAQSVSVPIGPRGSFYSRYGDVFAALCIVASALGLLARWLGLFPQ